MRFTHAFPFFFLSEILPNHRKAPQWEIVLYYVSHKCQQQTCADSQQYPNIFERQSFGYQIQGNGCCYILPYRLQVIIDRILLLPYELRKEHRHGIAGKACPSTSHIAIDWHEEHIDGNQHRTSGKGEIGSPLGFIN